MGPFSGIKQDFNGRREVYKQDWTCAVSTGLRIFAPTFYIFFASALPVIAFGEQLNRDTDGTLSTVETLTSTAMCGIIHSIFGGQPLLILGVAEPTVIMYTILYSFCSRRPELGPKLFLAWAGWVCVWTSFLLILLAVFNACTIISRFTRLAEELFGTLITVLFFQEAVEGLISEFKIPKDANPSLEEYQFHWRYTNGLLSIIFFFGLLFTAILSRRARKWRYGTGWIRGIIADYGVPLMVVFWTILSYTVPSKVPSDVPRRLFCKLPWEAASLYHWTVVKDMGKVPLPFIFGAFIPAVMIAGLYFFDHSVASKLAQQKDFNLQKPSAYHYDILLLGIMTFICGILGLPPANGVLPQSPMHTKSLAILRRQMIRKKVVKSAKECIRQQGSTSELYGTMRAVFIEMDAAPTVKELECLKEAVMKTNEKSGTKEKFDPIKHIDAYLPVRVNEQRMSNLLQSLLVALSLLAISIIRKIPSSVLWGYFAYMAIDSLYGNQFWERLLLLFITPKRHYKILEGSHASFFESVPYQIIAAFTGLQFLYFVICYGLTWIPIGGILFPLPFFLLITIREKLLPRLFKANHLQELDASEYEEIIGAPLGPYNIPLLENDGLASSDNHDTSEEDYYDAEILDEMTTFRGELKFRTVNQNDNSRSFNRSFTYGFNEDRHVQVYPEYQ
ncbi:probable boron transporter 6 [Trifolium pratense]|nr:probable boron transporter 6 [Trifolium pratense]